MDINCPKEGAFSSAMPIPPQKRTALEINKQPITDEAAARNFQLIPFLMCSTAGGCSIKVISPDGDEDWEPGTTQSITWSSINLPGNVKIELWKGGSFDSTLSADEANDTTYSWAISSGLAAGTDYKIRITSLVDGTVYDESDADFTIALPTSITVTAPNGSESWEPDSTESITWSSVNLTGNVKIELYKDGSLDSTLTADTANTGSYSWAIDSELTEAADYKIRVTSRSDGTIYDESDANFELAAASDYDPPAVTSGLVVKLDAADPDSFDSGASTVWTNTVDDVEGDFENGPAFDDTDDIKSISFDGSDDYFNLVRDNDDLDDGWSLVVWMNPQELTSSGINGWFINLAKTYPYLNMGILHWPGGGLFGTRGYDAYSGWVTWDDEAFAVDEWHQFVLVNQNDGTYDVFLNNVKDTSPPTGFQTDTAPGDDILAGAYSSYGTASAHLETKIAQILLYDRSLSDAEVEDLWDGDKERFGLS